MPGQKKSSAIEHFGGYTQQDITKVFSEAIKQKHNVLLKGISPDSKKSYKNCAHKVWEAIFELCDETQMEYITFRAEIPFPQDDYCKKKTTRIEDTTRVLQAKLITIKK